MFGLMEKVTGKTLRLENITWGNLFFVFCTTWQLPVT